MVDLLARRAWSVILLAKVFAVTIDFFGVGSGLSVDGLDYVMCGFDLLERHNEFKVPLKARKNYSFVRTKCSPRANPLCLISYQKWGDTTCA